VYFHFSSFGIKLTESLLSQKSDGQYLAYILLSTDPEKLKLEMEQLKIWISQTFTELNINKSCEVKNFQKSKTVGVRFWRHGSIRLPPQKNPPIC
jgi:hypothetical protein